MRKEPEAAGSPPTTATISTSVEGKAASNGGKSTSADAEESEQYKT